MTKARRTSIVAALSLAALSISSWSGAPPALAEGADEVQLRARVEALKATPPTEVTTLDELRQQLSTLWQWGNSLALAGVVLPADFPAHVARARQDLRWKRIRAATQRRIVSMFERYIEELGLKEGGVDLGSLALSAAGPFKIGELITLEQTYTVGARPMAPGGGLIIAVRPGQALQTERPQDEGYLTVATSRPGARLVAADPWSDWETAILSRPLGFRLSGSGLESGDTITIRYGDTSAGSPGMRMQAWSNDQVTFPVLVDLEGFGMGLTLPWPAVEVVGEDTVASLNAIAPSVVGTGEPFTLAIRAEDRMENLASGGVPAYDVFLEESLVASRAEGADPLTLLRDLVIDEPGVYRFTVRTDRRWLKATSNPIWVQDDPPQRILWGDTHGHSGFAEGQGSPDGYYRFGRDVARLDFLSLSEHDLWMDDSEWQRLKDAVRKYDDPGRFSAILGYEWTVTNRLGGHRNVYYRNTEGSRRVPNQEAPELEDLYRGLREANDPEAILVIPHAHQAADWERSEMTLERLVEITSGHGTFEFFGQRYLENGFEVGFIGASDNHFGHPGYTSIRHRQLGGLAAVLATENSTAALLAAMRSRSTYATTGERIILDAHLNGEAMGRRVPTASVRQIDCRVMGTAGIESIDLFRNGEKIHSQKYLSTQLQSRARVQVSFESSTEVFGGHYNPRGARPWHGWIDVQGARLTGIERPWSTYPRNFRFQPSATDPQRLEFDLLTRGRSFGLILDLNEATSATRLLVHLEPAREEPPAPGARERPAASLPAEDIIFRLGDLRFGPQSRVFEVVHNVDSLTMQVVPRDPSADQFLSFSDLTEPQPGDYYYLRVTQVDGAMAWSSPWWVGERVDAGSE